MRLMSFKKLSLALTALLFGSVAFAQEGTLYLTLDTAIEIALDQNPTIKIAELDIQRAEYVIKESQSSRLPTVEGQGGYTRNLLLPVMFLPEDALGPGTGGAMRMGFENGYSGAINVGLPLYMPAISRSIALTRDQLAMSVESARASKVNMVKEVKSAYYNVLLSKRSYEVLLENKTTLERNVADIKKRFENGLSSEYDLLTAQVQLQNLLPNIDKAKSAVEIANYMVKVLLSLPESVSLEYSDSLKGLNERADAIPNGQDVNLNNNTDLSLLGYQIKLQEHEYKLSRANRLPQITGSFNITTQSQSDDFNVGAYSWASSSLAMLGVKVPIFTGNKNKYADSRIKIEIEKSMKNKAYTERNLNMQALSIISNMQSAKKQIASSEIAIAQARKAYEISQTRYNVEAGTILELNSSQVALLQAELNLNQAYYDLLTAQSEYNKLIGKEK